MKTLEFITKAETAMRNVTVCLFIDQGDVLLAQKSGGRGHGRWGGYGGELQDGETPKEAVRREVMEECGLIVEEAHLSKRAEIIVHKKGAREFKIHVYIARTWEGDPESTDEMSDPTWFPYRGLPRNMWPTDVVWMPLVLDGHTFCAKFDVRRDNRAVLRSCDYIASFSD